MPPWERKMFASIHIDPNVPLNVTRDFVALLQKNSPGLSWHDTVELNLADSSYFTNTSM